MADFKATPDDLTEIIRLRSRQALREQAVLPITALLFAAAAWWVWAPGAYLALGAAAAWFTSLYRSARSTRAAYLWRYAWLQEGVVVLVGEEGIRMQSARGESLIRWQDDVRWLRLNTCFVLEDEGEDVVVLPTRFLSTEELLLLHQRVAR